jgi:ABC-type phosphate/phosphonate transport system permease subunit
MHRLCLSQPLFKCVVHRLSDMNRASLHDMWADFVESSAELDTGNTAWMLVATALVLLMTPGWVGTCLCMVVCVPLSMRDVVCV